jgi:bifunctional non-homologous end joining protein LigD
MEAIPATTFSQPEKKDINITIDRRRLSLTNLNKIYWPDEKITKGDMIAYYSAIAPYIIPYLKNRPLSLKRNPNGILDQGFYHKDAGGDAPSWMTVAPIYSEGPQKTIQYLICNNRASLIYIANLGCIEINPWNSTIKKLEYPDYLVIDLDPSDENSFEQVIEAANVVRNISKSIGCESYCKTSGSTGLHVYIPTGAKYTYDEIKDFAKLLANKVVEEIPEFTTTERPLNKRNGKMYIDFLQNRQGQTLASVHSLRPKPGAPVSTPLEWKEVTKGLYPSAFNIRNVIKRVEKKGDLFAGIMQKGIDLKRALKKLGA